MDTAKEIGISPAMMFAYRSGKNPISEKARRMLSEAEKRHGIASAVYSEHSDSPRVVEEPKGNTAAFREYLSVLRGIREEAEKLAPGNADKAAEIFDRMLATWTNTVANKRRGNSATPWANASDAEQARQALAAADVERIRAQTEKNPDPGSGQKVV